VVLGSPLLDTLACVVALLAAVLALPAAVVEASVVPVAVPEVSPVVEFGLDATVDSDADVCSLGKQADIVVYAKKCMNVAEGAKWKFVIPKD
jgi:hypothetical protein